MIYNLDNDLDRERFKTRVNALFKSRKMVELTDASRRSLRSNSYLHTIISYFALEIGEKADYVKEQYYKRLCNKDIFVSVRHDDRLNADVEVLRSSADINQDEMSLSITRFRDWASEQGVYIPSGEEHQYLEQMYYEIERNRQYL